MNQSITQTITVTTGPVPGVPNTGFLAGTNENFLSIVIIGSILLLVSVTFIFLLRRKRSQSRKFRGFLSLLGLVGVAGIVVASATHIVAAAASLTLTPQNQTISVPQGGSVTVPTTATLNTVSAGGYSLTLVQSQGANGVNATVKTDNSGNVPTETPVTESPVTLKTATLAVNNENVNTTLTVSAAANAPLGSSDLKLTYVLTESGNATPTTMSALTKSYCTTSMATYDGTNSSAILTLHDPRGTGQDYRVAKLADGNCWMLDNLKLGSTTGTLTLTPSDSNVASNFILPQLSTKTTIDNSTNPGNDNDTPYAYGPIAGDTGSGANNYGYLYNWSAVTAGETTVTLPGDGTNNDMASYSICAAGWRLPTDDGITSDFSKLHIAFGGNGNPVLGQADPAAQYFQAGNVFNGVLTGTWYIGGLAYQGQLGSWWSSNAGSDISPSAYVGSVNGTLVMFDLPPPYRSMGFNARCVLQ